MTQQPGASEEFILKLLTHQELAYEILPKFHEDFVGSNLDYFRINNYITKDEYDELLNNFDYNPELRKIKVVELIIKHRDKPDLILGLRWELGGALGSIKEYIRMKFPEHYRELFDSDPSECDISPKDLRRIHRSLNKYYNAGIEIKKE